MNILSFDIEEWYMEKAFYGAKKSKYAEYDRLLEEILHKLDEINKKGTFFCVGKLAVDFPQVVRKIAEAGHEVGCHSNIHQWLNKMSYEEAYEDTHAAIDSLQQCIGKKVTSYRAPAFSIGENNKWMFEILAENGIEIDASIFPASRDFGGFENFGKKEPCIVEYKGIRIKEFPICTARILGQEVAFSGGGYFRFFPLWFVKNRIDNGDYSMCYFHIDDLTPEQQPKKSKEEYENYYKESGTLINRYKRYIKANIGKKRAFDKMISLIRSTDFISLGQAEKMTDWENAPVVEL